MKKWEGRGAGGGERCENGTMPGRCGLHRDGVPLSKRKVGTEVVKNKKTAVRISIRQGKYVKIGSLQTCLELIER